MDPIIYKYVISLLIQLNLIQLHYIKPKLISIDN